jgi:hypothetical protein
LDDSYLCIAYCEGKKATNQKLGQELERIIVKIIVIKEVNVIMIGPAGIVPMAALQKLSLQKHNEGLPARHWAFSGMPTSGL